ncbi:MAG: CotH kinase family protein [Verrucomicrobiales bacterium]|nr:CotH kinase family protein [Verrucomicrobiales bacterium]
MARFVASLFGSHPHLRLGFTLWILGAFDSRGQADGERAIGLSAPEFSVPGGVYSKPFNVEIRGSPASNEAVIRYTLDGTEPTEKSALYQHALNMSSSTYLRARSFLPSGGSSAISSESYTVLGAEFQHFQSSLPLLIIETYGQPIPHRSKATGSFRMIEPKGTVISITNPANWQGRLELSQRGNTSRRFPKRSYTIKLIDHQGGAAKSPLGGMPQDSDWVLYAPYFDRTQLRDVLAYELSNAIGRYAPRTRFVEVFVTEAGGRLENRHYAGVYVLEEKIKRGRHRVNLADAAAHGGAQGALGGFLFKMDHVDPGENGFHTARGLHFLYVHPKEREITGEQRVWLVNYLNDFERVLHGQNFTDPTKGYAKFLDVDAFIDHYWLVEMSKNVDGFRFSAFLQLTPGGRLKMGPIWDWDQSFGNADFYGGDDPEGWYWPNIRRTEINWFARLNQDPEFRQRTVNRWTELRRGPFSTSQILERMDVLVASLGEAQQRNSARWPTRRNYPDYVRQMKGWIQTRVEWIDRELGSRSKRAGVKSEE